MNKIKSLDEFLNEQKELEILSEADINYQTDQFALVLCGGSIGSKGMYAVFVGNQYASIIQTGNDKDALVEEKMRRNKKLSPGEKSYYGMSYKVIELTNARRKDIDHITDLQNKRDSVVSD